MELQPHLENNNILLRALAESDFENLYNIASDPMIWEQHPNQNRYQKEVFKIYFEGAIQSNGAFLIIEKSTNEIIGCSRFYDFNDSEKSVFIGYTFIGKKFWGRNFNTQIKSMMINHAFQFVDTIHFHIGSKNTRSQIAINRLGAIKIEEVAVAYYGEPEVINFKYKIEKANWTNTNKENSISI